MKPRLLLLAGLAALFSRGAVATLPEASDVVLRPASDGMRVTLAVSAPEERSCEDVELLVRLGRMRLDAGASLLDDLVEGLSPGQRFRWDRIRLSGGPASDERVELTAIEEAPLESDGGVLVAEREDRMFIRYRLPGSMAAGEHRPVELTLPFADQEPDRPLMVDAMVTGCAFPDIAADDLTWMPGAGLVGSIVLLRSLGLEGEPVRRQRRLTALQQRELLGKETATLIERELAAGANGVVAPFGVAAAIWLLPQVEPAAFRRIVVATVAGEPGASAAGHAFGQRFDESLAEAKQSSPLLWTLAMHHLVPRDGESPVLWRLFAMASHLLPPGDNAELLAALAASATTPERAAAARSVVLEAGAAMLKGVEDWPRATVEEVLGILGKWRVASAVHTLLEEDVWASMSRRVGKDLLLAAARQMTSERMPVAALDALGSEDATLRAFSLALVTGGGAPALHAVGERLTRAGYPPSETTDEDAHAADPALLGGLANRLQGILLAPLAHEAEEEAEWLQQRGGDCLAPLEKAREELHPQLVLREPLWSQCRALRAVDLLGQGHNEEAEALVAEAMKDGGDDPKVRARYLTIMVARGRRLFEQGDLEGASALLEEVDPYRKNRESLGLFADIHTRRGQLALEAGDREAARQHFIEARRVDPSLQSPDELLVDPAAGARRVLMSLLALLLAAGLAAMGLRLLARARAVRDFRMLAEEPPVLFRGPAGRRLLVGEHALLALGRTTYRLIPWAEITAAHAMHGASGQGGILLWHRASDAFLVPAASYPAHDELVEAVDRHLSDLGIRFDAGGTEDPAAAAENAAMARALDRREQRAVMAIRAGLAVALLAGASLLALDLGAGLGVVQRLPVALGVGAGLAMLAKVAVDVLFPPSRA